MLGHDLTEELNAGYRVIGMDMADSGPDKKRLVDFINCDITDRRRVIRTMLQTKPDLVIHLAAWTDVDGCENDRDKAFTINADGTEHVALQALDQDVPLVYLSTDFVFNGKKSGLYRPADRPDPINVYGMSKLDGEKKVSVVDKYIIVRTSWLYGSNGKNFVDAIINKAKNRQDLRVVADQRGTPTSSRELARALRVLVDILMNGKGPAGYFKKVYHVANSGVVSWHKFACEIMRLLEPERERDIREISSGELNRPANRPAFSGLDSSLFCQDTGYSSVPWQTALKEYLDEKKQLFKLTQESK